MGGEGAGRGEVGSFLIFLISFLFMAYSNLNFGQLLHKLDDVNIKNNVRSYERIKNQILSAKDGIFKTIYIYVYMIKNNAMLSFHGFKVQALIELKVTF